jgi:hypothetical protein
VGQAAQRTRFFANTALVMLVMVLSAFPFTYFQPALAGSRPFTPLYHIHGMLFFAWIGLYAWQTQLVAAGRSARHRELGLAGIAISAMMLPLGIALADRAIRRRMAAHDPHPFDFTIYNMVDIATFTLLMVAGIAAVTRHVAWHRRFVFGAALCLVGPAISRWFLPPWFITLPAAPPLTDMAPNLIADLFLIALALHDRRSLGRVHPATWLVAVLLVPLHIAEPFLASSLAWREVAPQLLALG